MDKRELLTNQMSKIGIELSDIQINQFLTYYDLLIDWNEKINLTAITEYEDVVTKHFVDSCSLIKAMDLYSIDVSILDLGTGAGFPGIPLKIVFPNLKITLLDSLNKRINFLNLVIDTLGLNGITAIHGRAEDYAHQNQYREQFDFVVSRAVANLSTLSEYCIPFVKKDGYFISYKSEKITEEIEHADKALSILKSSIDRQVELTLPDSDLYRNLVLIKKNDCTSKKYPRKAGTPSKDPLH